MRTSSSSSLPRLDGPGRERRFEAEAEFRLRAQASCQVPTLGGSSPWSRAASLAALGWGQPDRRGGRRRQVKRQSGARGAEPRRPIVQVLLVLVRTPRSSGRRAHQLSCTTQIQWVECGAVQHSADAALTRSHVPWRHCQPERPDPTRQGGEDCVQCHANDERSEFGGGVPR